MPGIASSLHSCKYREEAVIDRRSIVNFRCETCGRGLGTRAVCDPSFRGADFLGDGRSAAIVVERFLQSRRENETGDLGSDTGPLLPPGLGIDGARGPRTGKIRWEAETWRGHVTVHINCGCGRHISARLSTLWDKARRALLKSAEPVRVLI